MRTTLLAMATGVLIASAAPAIAVGAIPQVATPSDAPTLPPVVDQAPVLIPFEETSSPFAYPAVFLAPVVLLAGAAWAARAFTRDLGPTSS